MMTNQAFIADRIGVLAEVVLIRHDLAAFERAHGTSAETANLQRRTRRVCLDVLLQLFAYLSFDTKATN